MSALTRESCLTKEECRARATVMNRKHAGQLGARGFEVAVENDDGLVHTKVLLRDPDEVFYYPVEARVDARKAGVTEREAAELLLDYTELYFDEFFREGEDVYLPIDWASQTCEEVTFEMRGQIVNRKLEAMADALLGSDKADGDRES